MAAENAKHLDISKRINDIEAALGAGDVDRFVRRVTDFSNDFGTSEQRHEAVVLAGTFTTLKRDRRRGATRTEDYQRRLKDLQFQALELVREIEQLATEMEGGTTADITGGPPSTAGRTLYVSYAWADETDPEREAIVDRLMVDAENAEVTVRRDKSAMNTGDRISEFMKEIGAGDRIVVILSAKYLRSHYCMNELYLIWMEASGNENKFAERIAVFALDDADVWSLKDRAEHARYWQDLYQETAKYLFDLGERDRIAHLNMKRFSVHVGDILATITDTVLPKNYDELWDFVVR